MKEQWFQGVKPEDRANFKQTIKSSSIVLDKLREIVYNMHKDRIEVTFKDYDHPSWLAKQAHTNGYAEALGAVLKILDMDDAPTSTSK